MTNARLIWFPIPLVVAACMALSPPEDQPGEEGRKNLEAIRSILSSDPYRSYRSSSPISDKVQTMGTITTRSPETAVWPPDWTTAFFGSPSTDQSLVERRLPYLVHPSGRIAPSRSSAQDLKVIIPWKPTRSPFIQPAEPFHPVPPYFHPAPVGPMYPGTVRCVPDFFGGQRCLTN
jgi:hypothetical protein